MPQEKMVNFVCESGKPAIIETNLNERVNEWLNKHPNACIQERVVRLSSAGVGMAYSGSSFIAMSITLFYTEGE